VENKNINKYIIKKYIFASSVKKAIELDKKSPVEGCWIDEEWKKEKTQKEIESIGFNINNKKGVK